MNKTQRLVIILLLVTQVFFVSNLNASKQVQNDFTTQIIPNPTIPSMFWLDADDGYALNISMFKINGSNANDPTDMMPNDNLLFGFNGFPNWTLNPFDVLNVSVEWQRGNEAENGTQTFAPWVYNASTILNEFQGPPMLWPAIPVPTDPLQSDLYFGDLTDKMQGQGFSTSSDSEYFQVSLENSNYSVQVTYFKTRGLIYNYTLHGNMSNKIQTRYNFELDFMWALSPTNTGGLTWYTEDPILTYEVLQANGSDGWSFEVDQNQPSDQDSGPYYGWGRAYADQMLQVNMDNFRAFDIDGPIGYEMQLQTSTGEVSFNISIELPSSFPENNSFFLYPMFPVVGDELMQAYFGIANIVSGNYTTSITGGMASITYDDQQGNIIEATWNTTTGVMIHWKLTMNDNGLVQTLEFGLISFTTMTDIGLYWGENAGVQHTYLIKSLNTTLGHKLNLTEGDRGSGFLNEGELVYFELLNHSLFDQSTSSDVTQADNGNDESDLQSWYKLAGPEGSTIMQTVIEYPGVMEFDGPPMFYPNLILGTEEFFTWAQELYAFSGATMNFNSTHVWFDWDFTMDNFTGSLYAMWNKTTGVMLEYLVSVNEDITGDQEAFEMHLVYQHPGVPVWPTTTPSVTSNATSTTSTTTSPIQSPSDTTEAPSLPFSAPQTILIAIIAIPILRRKYKK